MFAGFADFAFYQMALKGVHLVAGFGRIVDLKPADMLTATDDAAELVAAEPEILAHMNADHAETCRLYATKLLGAPDGDVALRRLRSRRGSSCSSTARRCGCRSRSACARRACCGQVLKQMAEEARAA